LLFRWFEDRETWLDAAIARALDPLNVVPDAGRPPHLERKDV